MATISPLTGRPIDDPASEQALAQIAASGTSPLTGGYPISAEPELKPNEGLSLFGGGPKPAPAKPHPAPPAAPATGDFGPAEPSRSHWTADEVPITVPAPYVDTSVVDALPKDEDAPAKPKTFGEMSPAEKLAMLQARARNDADWAHTAAIMGEGTQITLGNLPKKSIIGEGADARAQQGVKDFLAQRDVQKQVDMDNPDSPMGKRATMLAQSAGIIKPGEKISANEWAMAKDAGTLQDARARIEEARAQHQLERDTQAKNEQRQEQRDRDWYEVEMAKIHAAEEKGPKTTPIPAKEDSEIRNKIGAFDRLDHLENAQHAAGHWDKGDLTGSKYGHLMDVEGPEVAAALTPNSRGNKELTNDEIAKMPGRFTSRKTSSPDSYWSEARKKLSADIENQLASMEASGAKPEQVAELRRQYQAALAKHKVPATGAAPVPQVAAPQARVRVSNGKETFDIDPADEADAAKDGFKRV